MDNIAKEICRKIFGEMPDAITRCTVGQGNYVYRAACRAGEYIIRFNNENNPYHDAVYWLEKLREINIPVPRVIAFGEFEAYHYLVLSYIKGKDIGMVYSDLSEKEKRRIAKEIVKIQNKVGKLPVKDLPINWSWYSFVEEMLNRAEKRISQNGYFDVERVERLRKAGNALQSYFSQIEPVLYLDDVSTKNLLIDEGKISGIIDIDWMGIGDKLTYVALTQAALLHMGCDTHYTEYILEEMTLSKIEYKAYLFYSLMYCVDFMGERGTKFTDKIIEADEVTINRLNFVYDLLWEKWSRV